METIIEKINSTDHESTSFPFWTIIDPSQNFKTGNQGLHNIAGMITGVFFSRKDAEDFLTATSYNFSKNAKVYCHSGHNSDDWRKLFNPHP